MARLCGCREHQVKQEYPQGGGEWVEKGGPEEDAVGRSEMSLNQMLIDCRGMERLKGNNKVKK